MCTLQDIRLSAHEKAVRHGFDQGFDETLEQIRLWLMDEHQIHVRIVEGLLPGGGRDYAYTINYQRDGKEVREDGDKWSEQETPFALGIERAIDYIEDLRAEGDGSRTT